MPKPHVFHFLLDHRIGGPHIYIDTFRKKLDLDFSSTIITTGKGEMTDLSLVNIRHIWKPLYLFEILINVLLISKWVITGSMPNKNSVIAVHGAANIAPLLAARIFNFPVVWYIHETVDSFSNFVKFGKIISNKNKLRIAIVANSAKQVYDIPNSIYLPGSVDEKFWAHTALDDTNTLWEVKGKNRLRLLTVSNLNPLKGIDILLDALKDIEFAWDLKIAGPSLQTHADYAKNLCHKASLLVSENNNASVEFLGWQSKKSIRKLLDSCDVFVLPSRSEACPISLLEAMAMGCFCVASDVGDVREMLQDDDKSKIFEPGAVESCKNAIIASHEIFALEGRTNRKSTIPETWKLDEVIEHTKELYNNLLFECS